MQGVWYRDSCRREADALGVGGWIRNRADGAVEAALEGDRAAVDRLVTWMRSGPPRAVVTGIEVVDQDPVGERGFSVG